MKINFANRQQLLGLVAISAVVLWAGDRLVIEPVIGAWKARDKRLGELQKNVKDGQYLLNHQRYIQQNWDNVRTNTLANNVSIAYGQVLQAVDRWATTSGVSVTSKRPQWKKGEDKDYNTLECGVDATGDLDAMARFIYEIEHDPLGAKISTVDISSRDNSGAQLTLALQLSFLQLVQTTP